MRETSVRWSAVLAVMWLFAATGVSAALTLGQPAPPAPVEADVPMSGESLVFRAAGAVTGCGVRLTGGAAKAAAPSAWFDVSLNVFRGNIAVAQSIAYEFRRSGSEGDSRPARVPVQSTWIGAGEGTARLGENRERFDSLVYSLAPDEALALFEAMARGQAISVGIKRWGEPTATVYKGTPALTAETRDEIAGCLAALTQ